MHRKQTGKTGFTAVRSLLWPLGLAMGVVIFSPFMAAGHS